MRVHFLPVLLLFNMWPFPFIARQSIEPVSSFLLTFIFLPAGLCFYVFALLCLIDSNMGFLNGLSSDLFSQELMTQNDFKDA